MPVVLAIATLAGCATEVDPEVAVDPTGASPPTTEFVATGSTAELLAQLLAETGGLSEAIVSNEVQHDIIGRIDVIWTAARPGVESAARTSCSSSTGRSSCSTPASTAVAPPTPTRPTTTSAISSPPCR